MRTSRLTVPSTITQQSNDLKIGQKTINRPKGVRGPAFSKWFMFAEQAKKKKKNEKEDQRGTDDAEIRFLQLGIQSCQKPILKAWRKLELCLHAPFTARNYAFCLLGSFNFIVTSPLPA